jgi:hypothetical protein
VLGVRGAADTALLPGRGWVVLGVRGAADTALLPGRGRVVLGVRGAAGALVPDSDGVVLGVSGAAGALALAPGVVVGRWVRGWAGTGGSHLGVNRNVRLCAVTVSPAAAS